MKTLAEHDAEKMALYHQLQQVNQAYANGIACPACGRKLWDTSLPVIPTIYPQRKQVRCIACCYAGTRIE